MCNIAREELGDNFNGINSAPLIAQSQLTPACDDPVYVITSQKVQLCCNPEGGHFPCGLHVKIL